MKDPGAWIAIGIMFTGLCAYCWFDPPSRELLRGNPGPYMSAYFGARPAPSVTTGTLVRQGQPTLICVCTADGGPP